MRGENKPEVIQYFLSDLLFIVMFFRLVFISVSLSKYDKYTDRFFDNKIYINKFGVVTENPDLAEDLIVTNINHE